MGVAVHYAKPGCDSQMLTVAGQNEIDTLWKPLVKRLDLPLLDYVLSAGLSVDTTYHAQIIEEVKAICHAIEEEVAFVEEITNPVYRCRRLLSILQEYFPEQGCSVYIG